MALTIEEVRRIARLARLALEPDEERTLLGQLERIVAYIDQLEAFHPHTSRHEPVGMSVEAADAPRPERLLPRERFLANAPEILEGFLVVPQVKTSGGDG
jgi:aspartyl-tRNA(Asn)/glutamyl-tRNA(Gln) amidotransferase subunit C